MALLNPAEKARKAKSAEFERKMLKKKVLDIKDLPTPSASIMKLMLLLRDEEVNMNELVATLEKDQTMVSQILKLINSGFYGLRKTIDSVDRAVNLLGIINVKQVVYSASLMDMFSEKDQLDWNHSYSSSVLVLKIMKKLDVSAASNLSLTMLMHDIGKVVLRRYSPTKYKMAAQDSLDNHLPIYQSERTFISVDHAEVAYWLMEKWQMTADIIFPIKNHHETDIRAITEYVNETAIVQYTNWIDSMARGLRCEKPDPSLMKQVGINLLEHDTIIHDQQMLIQELEGENEVKSEIQGSDMGTKRVDRITGKEIKPEEQLVTSEPEPEIKEEVVDEFEVEEGAKANFPVEEGNDYRPESTNVFEEEDVTKKKDMVIKDTTDMGTAIIDRP